MRSIYVLCFLFLFTCGSPKESQPSNDDFDVVVYGGSSAGVVAACAAARLGKTALLISPDEHLGGLTTSGLGATDVGNKIAVTGMARQFYRELGKYYDKPEAWAFEPHHAEEVYERMITEAGITVWRDHHLTALEKAGKQIVGLTVEEGDGSTSVGVRGRQFIDATYTGDLLAAAGVSFTIGRESNVTYGETINGVQVMGGHQFPSPDSRSGYTVDPYVIPGDASSGLVYGIADTPLAPTGSGDSLVQAYNYRLCLTQDKDNQVPFTRPADYDPAHYELLRRLIQERDKLDWKQDLGELYLSLIPMPNGKTDVNNKGPFSTDFIGMNYDYPGGDRATRRRIEEAHEAYIRGLLYFLSTDPGVTPELREQMASWGWAADEFTDNNYFPRKLYIREGRRMVGEYVMTEHHCRGTETVTDGIGLAAYTMDSHNCQRLALTEDGKAYVKNEGNVEQGGFPPFQISYRSLVPQRAECENLLVPVCLSSSHIAYGSIRMEPVFMVLAQTAALAAATAIDRKIAVQDVPAPDLVAKLTEDPRFDGSSPDILVDNLDSTAFRADPAYTSYLRWMGTYNLDALSADNTVAGQSATFTLPIERDGTYDVFYYIPQRLRKAPEYTDKLTGSLRTDGKEHAFELSPVGLVKEWLPVGRYDLKGGKTNELTVVTGGGPGLAVADAVLVLPVE